MSWCRPGDKPLSEPMMFNLLRHICITWPQWVKGYCNKHPKRYPCWDIQVDGDNNHKIQPCQDITGSTFLLEIKVMSSKCTQSYNLLPVFPPMPCHFQVNGVIWKWSHLLSMCLPWRWDGALIYRHMPRSIIPDSKVHGANMGPIWGQQDPGGPHVGSMNFIIRDNLETIILRILLSPLMNLRGNIRMLSVPTCVHPSAHYVLLVYGKLILFGLFGLNFSPVVARHEISSWNCWFFQPSSRKLMTQFTSNSIQFTSNLWYTSICLVFMKRFNWGHFCPILIF